MRPPAPLVPPSLSSVGGGERRGITPDLLAELTMSGVRILVSNILCEDGQL